jgi:hypothetical protein
MAAKAEVGITLSITGLGKGSEVKDIFSDSASPEVSLHSEYQVQEAADVAQALVIGAVDTIRGVWIRAIDNDMAVDTSFVSTFNSELVIKEGTSQYFCPSGVVYIKNNTALEKVAFEYLVFGLQD